MVAIMSSLILLKPIIFLARIINLVNYYLLFLREKFTKVPDWVKELCRYYRTTPAAILNQYQNKRSQTAKLWHKKKRSTINQIHSFYQETDYFVYRQVYFNHRKSFWDIALALFLKKEGNFCEYGGGVGPVTRWCLKKFPRWHYQVVDLNCPVLNFSRWRFHHHPNVTFGEVKANKLPLRQNYGVIVCKQVLEHVPNPLEVVKHLVKHLQSGGWLFLDYVNDPGAENLTTSSSQREAVLKFLHKNIQTVFSINPASNREGYGLYVKK